MKDQSVSSHKNVMGQISTPLTPRVTNSLSKFPNTDNYYARPKVGSHGLTSTQWRYHTTEHVWLLMNQYILGSI